MNLLQRLFGKKKVENQLKNEIAIPKKQNFSHIPKNESDWKQHQDNEMRKRYEVIRTPDYNHFRDALLMGTFITGEESSSHNSDTDIKSSSNYGFESGFGGGGFSGSGSGSSWDDNSSSSSGYDSGISYDSGSSDSSSSSFD